MAKLPASDRISVFIRDEQGDRVVYETVADARGRVARDDGARAAAGEAIADAATGRRGAVTLRFAHLPIRRRHEKSAR